MLQIVHKVVVYADKYKPVTGYYTVCTGWHSSVVCCIQMTDQFESTVNKIIHIISFKIVLCSCLMSLSCSKPFFADWIQVSVTYRA